VAQGTPEQVARVKKSFTGQILARALNGTNGNPNGSQGSQIQVNATRASEKV
jgi:hypothetical protein